MSKYLRYYEKASEIEDLKLNSPSIVYCKEEEKVYYNDAHFPYTRLDYIDDTYDEDFDTTDITYKIRRNASVLTDATIISAYCDCNSLTSISGIGVFEGCSKLASVTLSNHVTKIGLDAFSNCSSLSSIVIPDSVTSIGSGAFYHCSSLSSINIPDSITSIDYYMTFTGCDSLPIEDGMRYADTYAVKATDTTKEEYTIKDGTKWIGYDSFINLPSLTSVVFPSSVINISYETFYKCPKLTSITVQSTVPPTLGSSIGYYCDALANIYVPSESVAVYKSATNWSKYASKIKSIS